MTIKPRAAQRHETCPARQRPRIGADLLDQFLRVAPQKVGLAQLGEFG
jgi:hypothetical protein